jgi:hypothetical protein
MVDNVSGGIRAWHQVSYLARLPRWQRRLSATLVPSQEAIPGRVWWANMGIMPDTTPWRWLGLSRIVALLT